MSCTRLILLFSPRHDSSLLPVYAAGISLLIFLLAGLWRQVAGCIFSEHAATDPVLHDALEQNDLLDATERQAGAARDDWSVKLWQYARLACCVILLALCFHTAAAAVGNRLSYEGLGAWMEFDVCTVYLYMSLLAVLSVLSNRWISRAAGRHLTFLLLFTWACYAYRDLWPLITFTLSPVDSAEGSALWTKIFVLTFAAIIVPLCKPRRYVPVDFTTTIVD